MLLVRFYLFDTDSRHRRGADVVEKELLFARTGQTVPRTTAGSHGRQDPGRSVFVVFARSAVRGLLHAAAIRIDAAFKRQEIGQELQRDQMQERPSHSGASGTTRIRSAERSWF